MISNALSDEDKKLFEKAMEGVTPLRASKNQSKINPEKKVESMPERNKSLITRIKALPALSDYISEKVSAETLISYSGSIERRRFNELKRGKISYQQCLDLHQKTIEEARRTLWEFIQLSQKNTQTCVLIIHGKGHSSGDYPVLKNIVSTWLKQLPEVLAYHSALPKHGGAGALYVLLCAKKY